MRLRLAFALIATCILFSAPTSAQRLKFKGDQPEPGSGKVVLELARTLKTEEEVLKHAGIANARVSAKAAYLRTAGTLLENGEAKAVAGTPLVIAAEGMARDRVPVFTLIDSGALTDGELALLASDLTALAEQPSIAPTDLDRMLRDAFALVLQRANQAPASGPGAVDSLLWPWPEQATAPPAAWPDMPLQGDSAAALTTLHERIQDGEKWFAYRPGARAMTRLVSDAAWPFGREKQVGAGAYKRWTAELSQAAQEIVREETGATGLLRLQRLAALGRVFALLESLQSEPGAKGVSKSLMSAVELMPEDPPQSGAGVERLQRLEQWLRIAATRSELSDDKQIVRQLRPAYRSVQDLCKSSQLEAFEALTKVAAKAESAGDPGVMAAVNLHRENIELLRLLHRASAAIEERQGAGGEPVAGDSSKPLADALLKLAKEVADPKQRDRSLAALRNLAGDVADLIQPPGERDLREKSPALSATLGAGAAPLLAAIDRERAAWRKAVAGRGLAAPAGGEDNAARMRAIALALALARDIAECKDLLAPPADHPSAALRQWGGWGGWWVSDEAFTRFVHAAENALPDLIASVTITDTKAMETLAAAEKKTREHSLVSLAAMLSRELRMRQPAVAMVSVPAADGASPSTTHVPPPVPLPHLAAVATGTPDPRAVLFAEWREPIAVICRYANEGAAGNDESAAFAEKRAADLVNTLQRLQKEQR